MKKLSAIASNERGVVSILFALLLFSFFAIAGILIDLGLTRATQSIMQTAADGSAITGLSFRDSDTLTENDRRVVTAMTAARNFSHQVQGDTAVFSNDDRQLGAGPVIELDDGLGAQRASQMITLPENNQYLPELELNLANSEHGDMVSGDYDLSVIHTPGVLADPAHEETNAYHRAGFTPDDAEPYDGNAFLVRLRRTTDALGLDNQEGVSSSGPPLPVLFGRGAAIKHDESYDIGAEGRSVRASAIAMAQPAKTVGKAQVGIKGVTPFVITRGYWDDSIPLPAGVESLNVTISVGADGFISDSLGMPVGRYIFENANDTVPISVGMIAGGAVGPIAIEANPENGYVPIVVDRAGDDFVIGFGRVRIVIDDADGVAPYDAVLTKFSSRVADENASVSVNTGFDGLDVAVIEFLVNSNQTEGERFSDPLLAPALVR